MPRVPIKATTTMGLLVYRTWRRLPAAQRRQLLDAARVHGPRLAAAAAAAAASAARARATRKRGTD